MYSLDEKFDWNPIIADPNVSKIQSFEMGITFEFNMQKQLPLELQSESSASVKWKYNNFNLYRRLLWM